MNVFSISASLFALPVFLLGFLASPNVGLLLHAEAQAALPDLVIEDFSYIVNSERVELKFTLANRGTAPSGGYSTFIWHLLDANGNILAGADNSVGLPPLAPGETVLRRVRSDTSIPVLVNPPAGTVRAQVIVDDRNRIAESDETNNVAEVARPLPDLVIESLSYTMTAGQAELHFNITNRGTLASGYSTFTWDLLNANGGITSSYGRSIGIAPIAPGASMTLSFRSNTGYPALANPPTGTVKVRVQVDQDYSIVESNEDNNAAEVDRPFTDLIADLTVESLNYTMTADYAELTFILANHGTLLSGPTTFLWKVLNADGSAVPGVGRSVNLDSLVPGASIVHSFRSDIGNPVLANPPTDTVRMRVRVDQNNLVTESDETNNVAEVARPLPDLVIESLSYTMTAGQAELRFNVANRGTLASGYSTFTWDLLNANGGITSSYARAIGIAPIAPGAIMTLSFRSNTGDPVLANPPTGTVKVRVRVDQDYSVIEFNEDNNVAETTMITAATTGEALAAADEESASEAIAQEFFSDARPRVLPGNPLYFFKDVGRAIQSFATFDPEAKAKLHLRYAGEKILEANLLVDRGNPDRAARHLASYERDLGKIQQSVDRLLADKPAVAAALTRKTFRDELRHQILIGKVEKNVSAEAIGEVKEIRAKTIERVGDAISDIKNKDEVQRIIADALTANGSPFRNLRNLEVLKAIEEKVPEGAKDAIRKAQGASLKRFVDQIEALPQEHQKLFSQYMEKAGGDEIAHLKTLEALAGNNVSEAVQDQIRAAKDALISRVETKIEEAQVKNPEFSKKIFENLSKGTTENLRVIQEFENSAKTSVLSHVLEKKQEAIKDFAENLKNEKFIRQETRIFEKAAQKTEIGGVIEELIRRQEVLQKKELIKESTLQQPSKPAPVPAPEAISKEKLSIKGFSVNANRSLAGLLEGDTVEFTGTLVRADGTTQLLKRQVQWIVVGQIGSIAADGIFRAKLDEAITEYGEGTGAVIATYRDANGNLFTAKSPLFKVGAFVPAETGREG